MIVEKVNGLPEKWQRAHVAKVRNALSGIMVGVQTVLQDDPKLTCRMRVAGIRYASYATAI